MLIYDLSIRSLVTESGIPDTRKPSLVFGDRPTWDIRVMNAGQPADLSGVTGWTAAVAEDLNPGTRPMCRTTSGISEDEGVVSVPLDTQTDTFAGATANRGPCVCLFELCGLDGDGGVTLRVAFHAACRMEADPGAVGDLVPIETTEMTSAQVQAIAVGAARLEVEEIQGEIEQAAESAANSAETASGAASAASESAQAAQRAASTVPSPEGANPGDVPTVQQDGSVAYQPQQGGAGRWGAITGDIDDQTDLANALGGIAEKIPQAATAQNQLADKDFVNSSINNMAAFYITKDAAGNPFGTKSELNAATQYYSGGAARVPTKNDYTVVLHDESKGTIYAGYADFTATNDYIGYWVVSGADNAAYLVDSANKDNIGIVSGTTVAYIELPTTRYLYDSQWQYQYVVNNSGLTAAQWAVLNSGITAEKVATYDGYATGKADLENGLVPSGQLPLFGKNAARFYVGAVKWRSNYGLDVYDGSYFLNDASNNAINSRASRNTLGYAAIATDTIDYAVRSVSPLVTALPADAASPIALTDASATTREHSWTYTHAPDTAPTYQLPAVTDSTITHEIVLYLDLTSTASFSFTDSEGATVAVDTNGVTPAVGELWCIWCEYSSLAGAWIVRGMKDMEATA